MNSSIILQRSFFSKLNFRSFSEKIKKATIEKGLLKEASSIKVSFNSKFQMSKNNFIFRFNLEDENSYLGVEPCQYVNLQATIKTKSFPNGEVVSKPYHPISLDTDKGFVDFLIKIYNQEAAPTKDVSNYGIFSNYLNKLEKGQTLNLTGPYGNLIYEGKGLFNIKDQISGNIQSKNIKRLGLIAGGTGITPMFQLIRKICSTKNDDTAISLIYASKTIEELAFCHDLIDYDKKGKIYFYPVVEEVSVSNWIYGKGRINPQIIMDYLPSISDEESLILMCGPNNMTGSIKTLLSDMGYSKEHYFSFS